MFDLSAMMGKFQEAQKKMKEAQASLTTLTAEGESGAGMVKAKVNGKKQVLSLEIDASLFNEKDKKMVEDLTVAAVNKALENIEPIIQEHMKQSTSGIIPDIPGFDLSNLMK